jgi:hypothetical protein
MPRSRRLAEKIATGVSLAERGEVARLRLSDSQRRDLHAALDAMIDERDGSLTRPLLVSAARSHRPRLLASPSSRGGQGNGNPSLTRTAGSPARVQGLDAACHGT